MHNPIRVLLNRKVRAEVKMKRNKRFELEQMDTDPTQERYFETSILDTPSASPKVEER